MIKTLVVEDDFRVAEIHAAFVERVPGFTVVGTAHTADEAIRRAGTLSPDLVLLDMYLPDRSGLDVLRELRAPGHAPLDIIVITAAQDVETLRAALQGGVAHYLVKPFSFRAFRARLEAYAALNARLAASVEIDQGEVDHIIGLLRPEQVEELPKGLSPVTLEVVTSALRDADRDLSSTEVAGRAGVSRVTARRYLEHLVHGGLVVVTMRYGFSGRPEHRYRWAAEGDRPSGH
jgi:response regulator of citrate/malate metabolism